MTTMKNRIKIDLEYDVTPGTQINIVIMDQNGEVTSSETSIPIGFDLSDLVGSDEVHDDDEDFDLDDEDLEDDTNESQ